MMRHVVVGLVSAAIFMFGVMAGREMMREEVAAIADDIDHQNAFGACLAERWRAGMK